MFNCILMLLAMSVASLVLMYVILEFRISSLDETSKKSKSESMEPQQLYETMKSELNTYRISAFGTHRIISLNGHDQGHEGCNSCVQTVSLVTQCSLNHLHNILTLADRWNGPISVAVFTPSDSLTVALKYLMLLHKCYREKLRQTAIHLVDIYSSQPVELPDNLNTFLDLNAFDCGSFINIGIGDNMGNYDSRIYPYPGNLLRNVAVRGSITNYVFIIDIDMIPNTELYDDLNMFLPNATQRVRNDKSDVRSNIMQVLVVPAFEQNDIDDVPRTKSDLLQKLDTGEVRPFYVEVCPKCHEQTNYDIWKGNVI